MKLTIPRIEIIQNALNDYMRANKALIEASPRRHLEVLAAQTWASEEITRRKQKWVRQQQREAVAKAKNIG
jgi:hypothetical protein